VSGVLLEIAGLDVEFSTPLGLVRAVDGVSLEVHSGECLAVVGESGSGKTQLFLGCLGLLAQNGRVTGSARLEGRELVGATRESLDEIRGTRVAMVFQDPMNALTPHLRIGRQLTELVLDRGLADAGRAREQAAQVLESVGIDDAAARLNRYPHEFSGGQRQRIAIAMALMARPQLLIADEPTTALDVTVQAQVLALLRRLREQGLAIVMITHDLGVVAGLADRVAVMYAGRIVETAPVTGLFAAPAHPYTAALLAAVPRLRGSGGARLESIEGLPPRPGEQTSGCAFAPRCPRVFARCRTDVPEPVVTGSRGVACHRAGPKESAS
jgi:oligopeptide transport system ATP-binding protein